jgi:hypothetical protein
MQALGEREVLRLKGRTLKNKLRKRGLDNRIFTLDLSSRQLGDVGASALGKAIATNVSIRELTVMWNDIGDSGAKALGEAIICNTSLTKLNLSYNDIGDEGCGYIAGRWICLFF